MRNVIPCPSPNGTNYECLYIVREPTMALDAAMDPDDDAPDAYEELATFLQQNLSPDVLGEAETLLRRFVDQIGDGNLASDQPPPFSGRPRPGGVLSMDEMHRRVAVGAKIRAGKALAQRHLFDKRFPNAARIRNIYSKWAPPRRRRRPPSAKPVAAWRTPRACRPSRSASSRRSSPHFTPRAPSIALVSPAAV